MSRGISKYRNYEKKLSAHHLSDCENTQLAPGAPGRLITQQSLEQNDYRPRLLYLHGAHLLGGYAMPAPVEFPVIGRCPAEECPAQRHGGLHRSIPTAVNGAGESPDSSCGYILERGSKDSLSASQSQH